MFVHSGILYLFVVSILDNQNTYTAPNFASSTLVDGWLPSAKKVASSNFSERPDATEISLLLIHNISLPPEQFGSNYIEQFFCNRLDRHRHPYFSTIATLEVSSHFVILRTGEIIQFVSTTARPYPLCLSHAQRPHLFRGEYHHDPMQRPFPHSIQCLFQPPQPAQA